MLIFRFVGRLRNCFFSSISRLEDKCLKISTSFFPKVKFVSIDINIVFHLFILVICNKQTRKLITLSYSNPYNDSTKILLYLTLR